MKLPAQVRSHPGTAAFTLMEVLVASTVFLLLIVLFAQVLVNVSQTAVRSNSDMDNLGDARQTLDIFAQDWNARVRRVDVSMQATANTITFLSQVRGYNGTRQLATVSYQVDATSYKLTRGTLGYNWLSTDATPDSNPTLVFPATNTSATASGSPSPTPLPSPGATPAAPAAADYEAVSDNVFHMAVSFLTPTGFSMDSSLLNSTKLQGVVVTVAVLDPKSRKIVSAAQLATLGTALDAGSGGTLPTSVVNAVSPLTVWQQNLNAAGFAATAGVPTIVAGAVRVYQRVFYLQE